MMLRMTFYNSVAPTTTTTLIVLLLIIVIVRSMPILGLIYHQYSIEKSK